MSSGLLTLLTILEQQGPRSHHARWVERPLDAPQQRYAEPSSDDSQRARA
jgi:hypothetical protein